MTDDTPITDADEIDFEDLDVPARPEASVPTKDVVLTDTPSFRSGGLPSSQNPGMNTSQISIPDYKGMGMESTDTKSLFAGALQRHRQAIEEKTWEVLLQVAEDDERKTLDAQREGKFIDVLWAACDNLRRQGGDMDEAYLFMNREMEGHLWDWMDEHMRFDNPATGGSGSTELQVGGTTFEVLFSERPRTGQIVMVGDEMYAAPHRVPCVVIKNLPIGLNIRLEVDGEDNDVVID